MCAVKEMPLPLHCQHVEPRVTHLLASKSGAPTQFVEGALNDLADSPEEFAGAADPRRSGACGRKVADFEELAYPLFAAVEFNEDMLGYRENPCSNPSLRWFIAPIAFQKP